MKGIVSVCILVAVTFGLGQGITAERPTISPESGTVIQAGEELNITCTGKGRLQFSVQNLTGRAEHSAYTTDEDNGIYTLRFPNAKEEDTGWYACAEEGIEIQNDEQTIDHLDTDISWTYVYVNSSKPFAVVNNGLLPVVAGRTVVIPCRPTSESLQVTIKLPYLPDGAQPKYEYVPKVGFIIKNPTQIRHDNVYQCSVKKTGETSPSTSTYILEVSAPEALGKPVITQGTVIRAFLGKYLELDCEITVPKRDKISMYWDATSPTRVLKEEVSVSNEPGFREKRKSTLKIAKVQESDRGEYICRAKGFATESSSSPIQVQIWEPGNITGEEVRVNLSRSATLSCHLHGYSMSNFSWVKINNPENRTHSGTENHKMFPSKISANMTLDFTNVTRKDNGTYECSATDYNGALRYRTDLIVTSVPEISKPFVLSNGSDSVYLNWTIYNGNYPVTAYYIQKAKYHTDDWINCSEISNVNNTSYVATELDISTDYKFRISAENAIGRSETVYSGLVTTQEKDDVLEFITEFKVEQTSNTSITIYWIPPQGEIRNRLHYYQLLAKFGNEIRKVSNLPISINTYIFHNVTTGAEYKVKIEACNMYTSRCVRSTAPKTKGNGDLAVYLGFFIAIVISIIAMRIWMVIRRRREIEWRREFRLAAFNAAML